MSKLLPSPVQSVPDIDVDLEVEEHEEHEGKDADGDEAEPVEGDRVGGVLPETGHVEVGTAMERGGIQIRCPHQMGEGFMDKRP